MPGTSSNKEAVDDIQKAIDSLQQAAHFELSTGLDEINKTLANADLKALEGLALDNERNAAREQSQK